MQMTLTNFETFVDAKIVERGRTYYQNGSIPKVEQVGDGEYSAIAFGSFKYHLYVKINDRIIIKHSCDCPYDYGDICKHKVAVFYKIRVGSFVNINRRITTLLNNLHDDSLRRFVSDLLKKDRDFRHHFLREFDEDFYNRFDKYNY